MINMFICQLIIKLILRKHGDLLLKFSRVYNFHTTGQLDHLYAEWNLIVFHLLILVNVLVVS